MLPRTSCSPNVDISIPSISIIPFDSAILSSAATKDDLPAPVRPMIPT